MDLKLKKDERIKWLDAWGSIDTDTSNSVDAAEFLKLFRFEPNEYARKLYNIYDAKKNNSIPFHDFLITTWRLCHVSRESRRRCPFRLLRRSSRFNKLDSTLDVRDVQRFVEHRYGFKKASAKKKSLQIFQFVAVLWKSTSEFSPARWRGVEIEQTHHGRVVARNDSPGWISTQTRTDRGAWTSRSSRPSAARTPSS